MQGAEVQVLRGAEQVQRCMYRGTEVHLQLLRGAEVQRGMYGGAEVQR